MTTPPPPTVPVAAPRTQSFQAFARTHKLQVGGGAVAAVAALAYYRKQKAAAAANAATAASGTDPSTQAQPTQVTDIIDNTNNYGTPTKADPSPPGTPSKPKPIVKPGGGGGDGPGKYQGPPHGTPSGGGSSKTPPQLVYTVKDGDNLFDIAERLNLTSWQALYEANKQTIGPNPNLIHPGQRLTYSGLVK